MAADGKRKTTGALGVVLALALTVVVAGGAAYGAYAAASAQPGPAGETAAAAAHDTTLSVFAAPAVQTVRMPEENAASAQTWRSSGVSCGKKTRPKARSVRITRPSNRSTVLWSAASSAAGRAHILS